MVKRNKEKIGALRNNEGVLITENHNLKALVIEHFTSLFKHDTDIDIGTTLKKQIPYAGKGSIRIS